MILLLVICYNSLNGSTAFTITKPVEYCIYIASHVGILYLADSKLERSISISFSGSYET